ncbi:GAF domain-containing protein [Paenibacillus lemnae]|uniref:Circadian input-output histidine kinase CikA n=1 Tax=Paenibacillus lemnae TaxID=1330551 RepID=A0A848M5J2_PAELE|nr:GAF domain-containing protein [Paenibacillus lemnae]NMO95073.1 histidine kinase [Paenibacillus lemnae]
MLKTDFVDVLSVISQKLYNAAAQVMDTASRMIPANTFCIANLDDISTKVLKAYNRDKIILGEGLVVENAESYCALVTEHAQGPLVIHNNLTHPLTREMDATQFVGGCSFIGVPIRDERGEVYGSLCSFDQDFYKYEERDVELLLSLSTFFTGLLEMEATLQQLREAEEAAAQVMEEKNNLLAVLSHEIRTPINGVIGMADLLQSTELTEDQTLYVDVIQKSSTSLLGMMDHILEYSKMESGTMTLDERAFTVSDIMNHVLQLFAQDAKNKGLKLQGIFDAKMDAALIGDSHKLTQILINLLGNALKYTEAGEINLLIHMSLEQQGTASITFEVQDTGIGIPADQQERLFRSFSQIRDQRNTKKYSGAGLGLSICKQLAELMGGRVWLESSSSEGSRFMFHIQVPTA